MQLKEIEKLAASVMEKAVDAKEVAGVNRFKRQSACIVTSGWLR